MIRWSDTCSWVNVSSGVPLTETSLREINVFQKKPPNTSVLKVFLEKCKKKCKILIPLLKKVIFYRVSQMITQCLRLSKALRNSWTWSTATLGIVFNRLHLWRCSLVTFCCNQWVDSCTLKDVNEKCCHAGRSFFIVGFFSAVKLFWHWIILPAPFLTPLILLIRCRGY